MHYGQDCQRFRERVGPILRNIVVFGRLPDEGCGPKQLRAPMERSFGKTWLLAIDRAGRLAGAERRMCDRDWADSGHVR